MRKIHPTTSLAVLLVIAATICFFKGFVIAALVLAVLGFFGATREVALESTWYQFVMVIICGTAVGKMLDYPLEHFPYLSIATFIAALASVIRLMFFKKFTYTDYLWTELSLAGVALVFYFMGNLSGHYDWKGYAFPAAILVFSLAFGLNLLKDNKQMLRAGGRGYQVKIGEPAKEFSLPDQDGNLVKLTDYIGQRHVLLIFVRGDWCPGCHIMLRTYEKEREKFQSRNVLVMAIGPDPVGVNREMVQRLGLDYKVLSDEGQRTAMIYGVQLQDYDNAFAPKYEDGIPLPASFLIDKSGIVRYVSRPDRVGEFLNPSLIFPVLETLG